MAIEIRELVIKATLSQDGNNDTANASTGGNNAVPASEENIVATLEKMIELLREKNER